MSELNQLFKDADRVFTQASDFIVSLYEGSIGYADDLSLDMAKEYQLNQIKDVFERIRVEREIQASFAFLRKLLASFVLIQVALLEDCLLDICLEAARVHGVVFDPEKGVRFTAEKALNFLQVELGISLPDPWPAWQPVNELLQLQSNLVTHTGLRLASGELRDDRLVKANEAIRLFLHELQSYLSNVEGSKN